MARLSAASRLAPLSAMVAAALLATPAGAKPHHHKAAGAAAPGNSAETYDATPVPVGPPPVPDSPAGDKATPAPPTLPDMTAYVLMDAATGAVLAEAAPDKQVPPASLAKLMTAHLTYQALHHGALTPGQLVPVAADATAEANGGSHSSNMFIDTTSVVTVDQLLHGVLIDSGADAAAALADQVAGSKTAFVQMMNSAAQSLGMTNTVYTNVDGLPDPAMHTSAMDVALLSRAVLQDEPEILQITKQPSYTWNNILQYNYNPLIFKDPTVDGLKTGRTHDAGHCIDATAVRGSLRLIAVVTGGPNFPEATAAVENLLSYGQKFFADTQIATAGAQIDVLQSDALDSGSVPVGTARNLVLTLPVDASSAITHSISYNADLTAGATKGETLGTATYSAQGKILGSVPVIALADAAPASFTTKLKARLRTML